MRNTFRVVAVAISLVGLSCASGRSGGIHYASGEGAVTPDGLHRVEWEPFAVTYVKPGADLQRYDQVLVDEATVSYKRPPRRYVDSGSIDPSYELPDSAVAALKRYFHDAFVKALGRSKSFRVVDAPGQQVLRISGHIVNLQIAVPPQQDQDPDERVYTSSSGQMTLILDARDSQSGEPLVRVGQARAIQMSDGGWYQSDPVTNSAAVRQIFDGWAGDLQRELDRFHSIPELPPVASPPPPN